MCFCARYVSTASLVRLVRGIELHVSTPRDMTLLQYVLLMHARHFREWSPTPSCPKRCERGPPAKTNRAACDYQHVRRQKPPNSVRVRRSHRPRSLFLFPQRRARIRTPYVPRDKQPSATCTPNKRKRREPDGTIPPPTRPRPRPRPTRRRGTGRASPRARADTMTQRPRLLPPARRLASPRPYVSARGNVF